MSAQRVFVEYHILQNYAPSNLNRDDSGSPKDAMFGQAVRGRISSQCLKRAMRKYVSEQDLLPPEVQGIRTSRVLDAVALELEKLGHPRDASRHAASKALSAKNLKFTDERSQYLLFLGAQEIVRVAKIVSEHWEQLQDAPSDQDEAAKDTSKKVSKKAAKKEAKESLPKEIVKAISDALDGGKAVDIALFGRMIADAPDISREASCQIAHAISTHRIDREYDFFTAVDDLQSSDDSGAGMLGTVEFSSACYYRYGVIDVQHLLQNLGGDIDLVYEGLRAFLTAAVHARPTGKQNSFAAHQEPDYVAFRVRTKGMPQSLANAFSKPVFVDGKSSLIRASKGRLEDYNVYLCKAYGSTGHMFVLDLTQQHPPENDLATILDQTISETSKALGAK